MKEKEISQVIIWLDRIKINAEMAINFSHSISHTNFHDKNALFWAVVKCAENVNESVVQLDNINQKIYPCLAEIPEIIEQKNSEELSWKGLKDMRSRLVHKFWDIDSDILWRTVAIDFPALVALLSTLNVEERFCRTPPDIRFTREKLNALTTIEPGSRFLPGQSLAMLYFDHNGNPHSYRIGRSNDNKFVFGSSDVGKRYSLILYELVQSS